MSCDSHNHPPLVERTLRGAGLCKIPPISSHATFRHHFLHFPTDVSVLYFSLNIIYRWIGINWPLVASRHIWHRCSSSRRPVFEAHPCYHYSYTLICRLLVNTGRTDLLRESVNQTLVLGLVTGQRGSQDRHGSKLLDIMTWISCNNISTNLRLTRARDFLLFIVN